MLELVYLINMFSMVFIMSNNPMTLVLCIIFSSVVFCFLMHSLFSTSWFSYILFLVFLGGLMVLFIYMCSVASNEFVKIELTNKNMFVCFILSLITLLWSEPMKGMDLNVTLTVSKMFFSSVSFIVVFTMIYLLLTLFVCVIISKSKYGPVRSSKN